MTVRKLAAAAWRSDVVLVDCHRLDVLAAFVGDAKNPALRIVDPTGGMPRRLSATPPGRHPKAQAAEASASTHVLAAMSIRAIGLMTVCNQTDLT
jgi:hypothetical protein